VAWVLASNHHEEQVLKGILVYSISCLENREKPVIWSSKTVF